jgi:hypothetical protein
MDEPPRESRKAERSARPASAPASALSADLYARALGGGGSGTGLSNDAGSGFRRGIRTIDGRTRGRGGNGRRKTVVDFRRGASAR